jgi:hypothetical protein
MKTLDFETIPNLSKLLASEGWSISEYKVEGENTLALRIVCVGKEKEGEGKNA